MYDTEAQLKKVNDLCVKHNVQTIEELNAVHKDLEQKVVQLTNLDAQIEAVHILLNKNFKKLNNLSSTLTDKRKAVLTILEDELHLLLSALGMPNAVFNIELQPASTFLANGKDELLFLLKANK